VSAFPRRANEFPAQAHGDVKSLDVSFNELESLEFVNGFAALESLVADSNAVGSQQRWSPKPTLTTLSVNNNKIDDLELFLGCVRDAFPNLTFVSLLKNPCCPNYFVGKDQQDYSRYRLFVVSMLPLLKFLDSTRVTPEERSEAKRVGHLMRVAKPQQPLLRAEEPAHESEEESPEEAAAAGRGKVSFGVSRYVYYGKQSEGNRFITNDEL
jgi:hypothetical protein